MGYDLDMDTIPDRLLVSHSIEELRQQKVRLWVKSLILSILVGVLAISTAVLAVLYGQMSPTSIGSVCSTDKNPIQQRRLMSYHLLHRRRCLSILSCLP